MEKKISITTKKSVRNQTWAIGSRTPFLLKLEPDWKAAIQVKDVSTFYNKAMLWY